MNRPLTAWHITPKDLARVLYDIELAERHGAVLVHCYHGADRTGVAVGMYRIIRQGWSIDDARREMMQEPYGFHPVWRNIPQLYTPTTVAEIQRELAVLRQQENPASVL